MKKKFAIFLSAVVIFLFGIVVWYHVPIDLMDEMNSAKSI